MSCMLIGMSCKLPTYYQQPLNEASVGVGGCKQSLSKHSLGQWKSWYTMECSCHWLFI